jgi:hypothetical protein
MAQFTGDYQTNVQDLQTWISINDGDGVLCILLAILQSKNDDPKDAVSSFQQGQKLLSVPSGNSNGVTNNQTFSVHLAGRLLDFPSVRHLDSFG